MDEADLELPRHLRDVIEREMEPGERLEWSGAPVPTCFVPQALGAFLFGIPWTAFSLFWTTMAFAGTTNGGNDIGLPAVFALFGLPFILVGIGLLSSPLWAYYSARKTAYAITDRRALVIKAGRSLVIRSFPPAELSGIYRKEKRDGSGDIIIAQRIWRDSDGDRQSDEVGFMRVRDVIYIERRLKELAQRGNPRRVEEAT